MKKFIYCIILLFSICLSSNAQKIDHSKMFVESYGFAFHTTESSIGNLGFIHIEKDKNNHTWLKYEVMDPYNVKEMIDSHGRSCYGMYNIGVGKHLYLKLSDNSIITLTCSQVISRVSGTTQGYLNYDLYSYFDLTSKDIEKLSKPNNFIIKMRCELKYDIMDMKLDKNKDIKLEDYFDTLKCKYNTAISKEKNKNELKNNPLAGF